MPLIINYNRFLRKYGCLSICVIILFSSVGCEKKKVLAKAVYKHVDRIDRGIKLVEHSDTLHFPLPPHTSNRISSFNCFKKDTINYIFFYDRGTKTMNIYDFHSGKLIKQTPLRSWIKSDNLDKATAYVRNFDSIYVATQNSFFLLDSSGTIKSKIRLTGKLDQPASINNISPLVFVKNEIYVGMERTADEQSIRAQQEYEVLYGLDTENEIKKRYYSLPDIYQKSLYGYSFLNYGYCLNDKGNFVFSFAADTNIYETNLSDYHMAYSCKSKFQSGDITPITKEDLKKTNSYKIYSLKDSYGAIFFDPYKKRYLRQAKQKMSEADYKSHEVRKKRSIIFMDKDFQIIGESEKPESFSFESIIFMDNGEIYGRANGMDMHALHFVRLSYEENDTSSQQMAQRN